MFQQQNFFDKYGNFNNEKFIKLLKDSQKQVKKKKSSGKGISNDILIFKSVSQKEIWQFINKLSIFVNSGIDIKGAFGILVKQTKNPYLKKICLEIKNNIDYGIGISESMMQYPKVFDNLLVALIGVGEKTGNLGRILSEMDQKLLENMELKGKVKGALIYPMILLGLTFAMVTFMMVFIIPKVSGAFTMAGAELPPLTQFIIKVSNFFRYKWYFIFGFITIILVGYRVLRGFYAGELFLGYLALRMPIFGQIVRQSNIVYFINAFTTLSESGVLLLDALKTASQVVPNIHYKREVIRIKNEVESGLTMSKSLGLNLEYDTNVYINALFPEEFAYIVNTGEETGTLADSLKKIGRNYTIELKRYIGNLATMLEPFIIIIVGLLVGTIVIAVMLPFFQMGKIAKQM